MEERRTLLTFDCPISNGSGREHDDAKEGPLSRAGQQRLWELGLGLRLERWNV
jgi:hypothetical protein